MPRHPPCALNNLTTTRCSHPLCNTQHTTTPHRHRTTTHNQQALGTRHQEWPKKTVSSQDPTVCEPNPFSAINRFNAFHPATHQPNRPAGGSMKGEPETLKASRSLSPRGELLRKEVIQPHLPVRLPCYDFVPIASPTFDDSLPQGVGPPASGVTNFRDVTGGVYKARERIHRSNADLRLLATPTSRGRVADPDPN
jgi:hypothetical protein